MEQMGYANPTQVGKGIHLRQYSRAFIISDVQNGSTVVFVNADICMGTQILKMKVLILIITYTMEKCGICAYVLYALM